MLTRFKNNLMCIKVLQFVYIILFIQVLHNSIRTKNCLKCLKEIHINIFLSPF